MPTDSLMSALEYLRDTYTARQRATNALLAALKGTTGTLTKASRALNDYAGQETGLDAARLSQAQAAFGALRLKEEAIDPLAPDLRRESKALAALTGALKDAQAALRGEVVDVVRLGRAHALLQTSKGADATLRALLPELEQELQQAQRALGDTFGQALRAAFAERGVDIGGRPPRFEIGRFDLSTDFVGRTATLSYGKELVAKGIPLSIERVVGAYEREARAITGRNEDGARWIEQFYRAWQTALRKRELADARANIVDCFYELTLLRQSRSFRSAPSKRGFVDYSRAQFAYDFFEFANRQRHAYQGQRVFAHTATKSQADSAEKSIWIVEGASPHDGRYIADIVFSKDG